MKKLLLCLISAAMLLSGCASEEEKIFYAMDTVMSIRVRGENPASAVDAAETEILRLDALFDKGNGSGEIARLNSEGSAELSAETAELIKTGVEIGEMTGGAFDITIAPVTEKWGFYNREYRVPTNEEIASALEKVGFGKPKIEGNTVRTNGASLDLGGIAKGYAADRAVEVLSANGIESGIISLGGNVYAIGSQPNGEKWRVAVQSPEGGYAGYLSLADTSAVTSGGYQRYFEEDGKKYHHIIDPATGFPADSGLSSVTVVCESSTLADGLSTALFVMGKDAAIELWRKTGGFELILIGKNNDVYVTEGLNGIFECADGFDAEIILTK